MKYYYIVKKKDKLICKSINKKFAEMMQIKYCGELNREQRRTHD